MIAGVGGSGFHFQADVSSWPVAGVKCPFGRELSPSCLGFGGDKKVIIWGQGTHLLGMDRLSSPEPQNAKHTPAP